MAWCHQVTIHYLNQSWRKFMSSYSVTRPQWVKTFYSKPCIHHRNTNPLHAVRGLLDDKLQCLPQWYGLAVNMVELQLVRHIGGGLQQSVELSLHHLILVLGDLLWGWHRETHYINDFSFVIFNFICEAFFPNRESSLFFLCHDSTAVVACVKVCNDLICRTSTSKQ